MVSIASKIGMFTMFSTMVHGRMLTSTKDEFAALQESIIEDLTEEPAPAGVSDLDWVIFQAMNEMRTNPTYFIPYLEERLQYFDEANILWLPGEVGLRTNEGAAAVEEGIKFLQAQDRLPAFEWRSGMAHGCQDHVEQMGPAGMTGHTGTDGSSPYTRMSRYGTWYQWAASYISYGYTNGIEVAVQLLVDDGNNSRGNRELLFRSEGVTGVYSGYHSTYKSMSCITYAGGYENNEEQNQLDAQLASWQSSTESTNDENEKEVIDEVIEEPDFTIGNGPGPVSEIDELQLALNDYVLNFQLPEEFGKCHFQLRTETDHELNAIKVVAAHGCNTYGIKLDVQYSTKDFEDKILREFEVVDENTGSVVFKNEEVECHALSSQVTGCQYYLSPTNQRFGLLMDINSQGLLSNQAKWVVA